MENMSCLPVFPPTIDLQSHGFSSTMQRRYATTPRPAGAQGWLRLPAAPGGVRLLPAARDKSPAKDPVQGWGKKQKQTGLVINPGKDPVLLPDTEQAAEDGFAYQWFYSPVTGCRQHGYILQGR